MGLTVQTPRMLKALEQFKSEKTRTVMELGNGIITGTSVLLNNKVGLPVSSKMTHITVTQTISVSVFRSAKALW